MLWNLPEVIGVILMQYPLPTRLHTGHVQRLKWHLLTDRTWLNIHNVKIWSEASLIGPASPYCKTSIPTNSGCLGNKNWRLDSYFFFCFEALRLHKIWASQADWRDLGDNSNIYDLSNDKESVNTFEIFICFFWGINCAQRRICMHRDLFFSASTSISVLLGSEKFLGYFSSFILFLCNLLLKLLK